MRTFVYKFEMSEKDWLSIHGKLDEAIRLLHELANDDYTGGKAVAADDALSDLESLIDDYGFKYEEPKTSEERITLEMDMQDYGYIVNVLKSMQRNLFVGRSIAEPYMMPNIDMCLNILEKSNIEKPEKGIEMSEEEWNKIRNGAISGRYEWKDNMPVYGPDPWKEIDILKDTVKKQADMICDIHGRIIPLTDMYNDHEDRLSGLYAEVDNIKDLLMVHDNKNDISKLDARTNRLYELIDGDNNRITSLHIKLDNKIDILEERMNNLVKNVGRIENNVANIEKDKKKLWDIVTGSDDSLDERFEGLKHTMECLIERDDCFFNKVKDLKNDMKELAQSEADKHNRLAMTVQNLKDFVDGKYDKGKLDIDSASFNIYFNRNKKEDDDE